MKRFDVGCVHVHVRGGGGVVPHCIPGWRRKRGACVMLIMTRMISKNDNDVCGDKNIGNSDDEVAHGRTRRTCQG